MLGAATFVASLGSDESATDTSIAWVRAELTLLREAIAAAVPVLGLCFGGQALAIALGGEVGPAPAPQVGWIALSGEGGGIPAGPWFHWPSEPFAVPPGAQALAHSGAGPAAFRHGPHLGLQFHPEVTPALIAGWSRSEAQLAALGIDAAVLCAQSERQAPRARTHAWMLFERWWARLAGH